ncbi:hypothetical protein BDR26DRAFT_1005747 [Obelidium mucronatum]|nr:hypothetical protein BDR26DRAFT_1005747 [Obelidium mucronatum]
MPTLKFDNSSSLSIVPSTSEKILTVTWQSEIKVPLSQIKSVRIRPSEAYKWVKGLKVGTDLPGVVTDATYHHGCGRKPDLHLYSTCKQAVAIDLDVEGDSAYGAIIIQVPNQTPEHVAQEIHKAAGLTGEIRDDQTLPIPNQES